METKFWHLSSPESVEGTADWDESMDLEQISCPVTRTHDRPGKRTTDLNVVLTSSQMTDFVWTWGSACMIQDRVLQLFRGEGFTGFEVKPMHARMKIRAEEPDPFDPTPGVTAQEAARVKIPILWELVVTGWGGMAPPESGVRLVRSCLVCGMLSYKAFDDGSRLIDEKQWDGSDFFIVWPYPKYVFVTDQVADFVRKHELTGAELHAPTTLKSVAGASPGRLSYWMPEPRARELGEPLGIY